jgi:hypothetical protein
MMNKIKPLLQFCCFAFYLCSCKTAVPTRLGIRWNQSPIPAEVDYSKEANWAALPSKKDLADSIPKGAPFIDEQNTAAADVFFIHPTILTYAPTNEYQWNGSVEDSFLNKKVDELTILNQASIFNGAGRIYAPRYRQAHYFAFVTSFKEDKDAALGIAYQDVKKAFDYYLAHYNQNRPIIIASHSQGTVHATQLIKEYFDGKPLGNKLVAAYIIGIATPKNVFQTIKPCENATQTGCFIAYTTFLNGYLPDWHPKTSTNLVSTNPITWTLDENFASQKLNQGGVSYGFKWVKNFADAQNHLGILWTHTPYVFGRQFVHIKNWHTADLNLYYAPIRENAKVRVRTYLSKQ